MVGTAQAEVGNVYNFQGNVYEPGSHIFSGLGKKKIGGRGVRVSNDMVLSWS